MLPVGLGSKKKKDIHSKSPNLNETKKHHSRADVLLLSVFWLLDKSQIQAWQRKHTIIADYLSP
jgi:hypothetical protein